MSARPCASDHIAGEDAALRQREIVLAGRLARPLLARPLPAAGQHWQAARRLTAAPSGSGRWSAGAQRWVSGAAGAAMLPRAPPPPLLPPRLGTLGHWHSALSQLRSRGGGAAARPAAAAAAQDGGPGGAGAKRLVGGAAGAAMLPDTPPPQQQQPRRRGRC